MVFSVKELSSLHVKQSNQNHESYKNIYSKIVNLIKKKNEYGEVTLDFEIPLFPINVPFSYNPSHCARYCREKLKRGGFDTTMYGNTLRINWGERLRVYKKKSVASIGSVNLQKEALLSRVPAVTSKTNGDIMYIETKSTEPLAAKLARLNARIAMK